MVFVDRGDSSSAISSQLTNYQSMAEFLKAMLDAARQELERSNLSEQQQAEAAVWQREATPDDLPNVPLDPAVAELNQVQEQERQQAMTEIAAIVASDLAQLGGKDESGEFYYQAESYTVYTTTPEDSTISTYRVADAEEKEILSFQIIDGKLNILEDHLSPEDKLSFVGAADNIHREGIQGVLSHADPNDRFARLGELSPAGTRAAWVAKVALEGRDDYPPLGKESASGFQFNRDADGVCRVTDQKGGQVLQIAPSGELSSAMSRDHLNQFKDLHAKVYQYVQSHQMTVNAQPRAQAVPSSR